MKFRATWFNIILLGLLFMTAGLTGCQSGESDRPTTTLRFHLETNPDPMGRRSMPVVVGRSTPFELTVEQQAFLSEVFVIEAALVETVGGFEIRIAFDRQGTWFLEQYTTANIGKRIAIFSQFGDSRWLAAPRITRAIADGVFVFTPDASAEEMERIVIGLKNVAAEVKKEW